MQRRSISFSSDELRPVNHISRKTVQRRSISFSGSFFSSKGRVWKRRRETFLALKFYADPHAKVNDMHM